MNRIDRLVAILTTLQSQKFVTAEFIASKYAISVRTVYRDLKAFGEIGVPITFETNKGYAILQGFFLPPISLTSEEANALILISTLSHRFADKSTHLNVENAISKIKMVLSKTNKDKADFLQSQIRIYTSSTPTNSADYLTVLQKSITDKQTVFIEYTNNNAEHSQREIEPIGLTFYSNQWHLVAWCWIRKAYRDFKVNQITKLTASGENFKKTKHEDLNAYIKSLQLK